MENINSIYEKDTYMKEGENEYYCYFRIPNLDQVQKSQFIPRNNLQNIFKINYSLRITSGSYLHIGNGLVRIDNSLSSDSSQTNLSGLDFIRDKRNHPIIPGSTLKGYTRSNFETVVPGCCFVTNNRYSQGRPACSLPRYNSDIKLCPSCNLFGVNTIMSRIHFSDAKLVGDCSQKIIGIPRLMSPSSKKYIRGTKKFYKPVNFSDVESYKKSDYIWVVEPGAIFKGFITVINSNLTEIKQIYYSFANLYGFGHLLLGHGKNIGLGKCEVIKASILLKKTPFSKEKKYNIKKPQDLRNDKLLKPKILRKKQVALRLGLFSKIFTLPTGTPYPGSVSR